MNKPLLMVAVALLVAGAGGWWLSHDCAQPSVESPLQPTPAAPTAKSAVVVASEGVAPTPSKTHDRSQGSPLAAKLNAAEGTAEQDVKALLELLRQYLRPLHQRQGPPIGDDIDLVRVLCGRNPLKLVVLPPNHPAISPDGHLRDRWGTPYFIHGRGYGEFEIRSAGPDRKMFTADDAVANPSCR